MFEQIGLDVLAEDKGFKNWEDYTKSLKGATVKVIKCFEGDGHEGKEGIVSGFDGDFIIVDFPNGDWCLSTEVSKK